MLLFPNDSCIEENHRTSLHCFRDKVFLYVMYYYKMCEITAKLLF